MYHISPFRLLNKFSLNLKLSIVYKFKWPSLLKLEGVVIGTAGYIPARIPASLPQK